MATGCLRRYLREAIGNQEKYDPNGAFWARASICNDGWVEAEMIRMCVLKTLIVMDGLGRLSRAAALARRV